ncbi:MAG: TylF/MycF/NovP-related O-methyltransferase [Parvibaculaceae bacterium]
MFNRKPTSSENDSVEELRVRLGEMTGERDGYKNAYEVTSAELGQLKAYGSNRSSLSETPEADRLREMTGERDGYKNAYEVTSAELGRLKAYGSNKPSLPETPEAGRVYTPAFHYDGLWTDPAVIHNHDFMRDPRYIAAFQAGETALGLDHKMYWRLHVALWCAGQASRINGDFVECGVWRGFLSTAIMTYLDWPALTKRFFLFDTFDGMVTDRLSDAEKANVEKLEHLNNHYRGNYEFVCQHFANFPRVEIVRGPVPDTLANTNIESVSFLSLDMNCAAPEIAAAEHFWPKMPAGAIILLDDYGFVSYEEQKRGFNDFVARHNAQILALPTGQGLIIKT